MSDESNPILQFAVGKQAESNAWESLLNQVQKNDLNTVSAFKTWTGIEEERYMDVYCPTSVLYNGKILDISESPPEIAGRANRKYNAGTFRGKKWVYSRKRNGTYKYRTFLPNTYCSAKSVISTAIENSIPLFAEGELRGKTAIQKDIKKLKDDKSTNIDAKCFDYALKIKNRWDKLQHQTKEDISKMFA